jgi:hypothetical protein
VSRVGGEEQGEWKVKRGVRIRIEDIPRSAQRGKLKITREGDGTCEQLMSLPQHIPMTHFDIIYLILIEYILFDVI